MIESRGVPHTEIDLIVVNDQPVLFDYIVQDEDRIIVYGPDFPPQYRNAALLRPPFVGRARFVLDTHLLPR
jgi:hypothetical protein